jgi:hypothetical protein
MIADRTRYRNPSHHRASVPKPKVLHTCHHFLNCETSLTATLPPKESSTQTPTPQHHFPNPHKTAIAGPDLTTHASAPKASNLSPRALPLLPDSLPCSPPDHFTIQGNDLLRCICYLKQRQSLDWHACQTRAARQWHHGRKAMYLPCVASAIIILRMRCEYDDAAEWS